MTRRDAAWPDAARPAVRAFLDGHISAPVALMRLVLLGLSADAIMAGLAREPGLAPLLAMARQRHAGLRQLEAMVRSGVEHGCGAAPGAAIARRRRMFDRLVRISPEASVAAYSLGDPAMLRAATGEVVAWLRCCGLLDGRPHVLDLGCGIGRIAEALAPHASRVLGLDISSAMIAAARQRCRGMPGLSFARTSGHDLATVAPGFDLVLAADVFPYLVEAGGDIAERHVADAARLLRPGGSLVILNFSYRGLEQDRADLRILAERWGFSVRRDGTRDLPLWDAAAFWLRCPGRASGPGP